MQLAFFPGFDKVLNAGKSEGRGFAGRNGDAVGLDSAEPRQRMHRCIAPPAAGAADGNQRGGFTVAERDLW